MAKKRREIRITLTEDDWETFEKLKKQTGIKSNTELVRFAFTRLIKYLNTLRKDSNK